MRERGRPSASARLHPRVPPRPHSPAAPPRFGGSRAPPSPPSKRATASARLHPRASARARLRPRALVHLRARPRAPPPLCTSAPRARLPKRAFAPPSPPPHAPPLPRASALAAARSRALSLPRAPALVCLQVRPRSSAPAPLRPACGCWRPTRLCPRPPRPPRPGPPLLRPPPPRSPPLDRAPAFALTRPFRRAPLPLHSGVALPRAPSAQQQRAASVWEGEGGKGRGIGRSDGQAQRELTPLFDGWAGRLREAGGQESGGHRLTRSPGY